MARFPGHAPFCEGVAGINLTLSHQEVQGPNCLNRGPTWITPILNVLIVGAGPTGLMLANQLTRRSERVLVIDRHAGTSLQTRALGVQARTMEIYAKLGIADRALELGKRGTGANIWAQARKIARVPLGEAGQKATPYPFILILGQDDNERIMGDKLCDLGVSVQWKTELVGLEQEPYRVAITLKLPDGTNGKMRAASVAGCDGAHSSVRELSGITFPPGRGRDLAARPERGKAAARNSRLGDPRNQRIAVPGGRNCRRALQGRKSIRR